MADLTTEIAQWRNRKPKNVALLTTVEIYHQSTGVHRLYNGFSDKTLTLESGAPRNAGQAVTFRAVAFEAPKPSQQDEPRISIPITINRIGSELKSEIKKIKAFGAFDPIEIVWRQYLSSNTSAPVEVYYLYAQNIAINAQAVTITATDENPLAKRVARIATTNDFPGLIDL